MKNFLLITTFSMLLNTGLAQHSDLKAQAIIDKMEAAMGGQEAFKQIKHITWNFFNVRTLTWDKHSGDVRIDKRKENSVFLYNLNSEKGRVLIDGVEYTQADSLTKYLTQARNIWINDCYWLLMPFKLNDPGVKAVYIGERTDNSLNKADVLQVTFEEVGVTPENKYMIYIDKKSNLVSQWDFFSANSDAQPRFSSSWLNYKNYGRVKLSGDRGSRKISDIHVFKILDKSVYSDFKRPSFIQ